MVTKRIAAFDIGNKRIGVAISDPFGEYAMPCDTYVRTGRLSEDVTAVAKIAEEKGAQAIVCGLPVNADGSESAQTARTRRFIEILKKETALPVFEELPGGKRRSHHAGGERNADRGRRGAQG